VGQTFGCFAIEFRRKVCDDVIEGCMSVATIEKFDQMLAKRFVCVHKGNLRWKIFRLGWRKHRLRRRKCCGFLRFFAAVHSSNPAHDSAQRPRSPLICEEYFSSAM
jgi:hypothetical protein